MRPRVPTSFRFPRILALTPNLRTPAPHVKGIPARRTVMVQKNARPRGVLEPGVPSRRLSRRTISVSDVKERESIARAFEFSGNLIHRTVSRRQAPLGADQGGVLLFALVSATYDGTEIPLQPEP